LENYPSSFQPIFQVIPRFLAVEKPSEKSQSPFLGKRCRKSPLFSGGFVPPARVWGFCVDQVFSGFPHTQGLGVKNCDPHLSGGGEGAPPLGGGRKNRHPLGGSIQQELSRETGFVPENRCFNHTGPYVGAGDVIKSYSHTV